MVTTMPGNDKASACRTFRKEVTVLENVIQKTLQGGSIMRIYKEINYVCDQCDFRSPDFDKLNHHTFEAEKKGNSNYIFAVQKNV